MPRFNLATETVPSDIVAQLPRRVQFTVSNFVRLVDGKLVGMVNRGDWNGKPRTLRVGCVGGAAFIGRRKPLRRAGAQLLAGDDFRIELPRKRVMEILRRCQGPRPVLAEHDAFREMVEELCEETIGARGPVLADDMLEETSLTFAGSAANFRLRQGACHLFRFFDAETGDDEILRRVADSGIAFVIDPDKVYSEPRTDKMRHLVALPGRSRPVQLKDSVVCAVEMLLGKRLGTGRFERPSPRKRPRTSSKR